MGGTRGQAERGRRCRVTAGPALLSGDERRVGRGSPGHVRCGKDAREGWSRGSAG